MSMTMSDGEEIVLDLHPHWGQLVVPALVLLVVCGLGGYGIAAAPHGSAHRIVQWIILAVAVVLIFWFTVLRYLRWVTTRYVLTTDRLIIRTGIVARHGRDVPLNRINDVSFSETLFERILRSGTLVVESAGERGQISLTDVPGVEHVQRELYRMVEENQNRRGMGAGEPEPQH
ncbi:MAG: PH domain-containing protein [Acidothermaceae bacterium]